MARFASIVFLVLVSGLLSKVAHARTLLSRAPYPLAPIAEASPTLAPFQHVRFCIRYPTDCKSNPEENERIDLNPETLELLSRVNRDVNAAIIPIVKDYRSDVQESWTISPVMGDCNDYAVTKRHELLEGGLPSRALRLSVVKTDSGIGHLVLVVATTKGDVVLDNLTDTIRSWNQTDYHWLKIQSGTDARFWFAVRPSGMPVSQIEQNVRFADR